MAKKLKKKKGSSKKKSGNWIPKVLIIIFVLIFAFALTYRLMQTRCQPVRIRHKIALKRLIKNAYLSQFLLQKQYAPRHTMDAFYHTFGHITRSKGKNYRSMVVSSTIGTPANIAAMRALAAAL